MNTTLATRNVASSSLVRNVLLVGMGVALTALCAQITVPFFPVPFTLQTFAVIVCGLTLGAKLGAASQIAYLASGAAGLPIFAKFSGGPTHLLGTTGGYLLAFVAAAWIVGTFTDRGWTRKTWATALGVALATFTVYVFGAAWLSVFVGVPAAVAQGVVPFMAGDVLKGLAAVAFLPAARWAITSIGR